MAGSIRPQEGEGSRASKATVFVSDPSVEAERIAQALRTSGYLVVDVPMSMLVARVAVQRPRVILVDADADGALDAIVRMRELPESESIDVLFLGRAGNVVPNAEDELASEGSGFFSRPVDIASLVSKVEALTTKAPSAVPAPPAPAPEKKDEVEGPPSPVPPPPLHAVDAAWGDSEPKLPVAAPSSAIGSRPPPPAPSATSLPPPSMRAERPSQPPPAGSTPSMAAPRISQPPPPPSLPSLAGGLGMRRGASVQGPISAELAQLLAEAEERVGAHLPLESTPPSPEEEIEAVLPEEILAALDEPLEEEEEDDELGESMGSAHGRATTSGGASKQTTGASRRSTTGGGRHLTTEGPHSSHHRTHGEAHSAPLTGPSATQPPAGGGTSRGFSPTLGAGGGGAAALGAAAAAATAAVRGDQPISPNAASLREPRAFNDGLSEIPPAEPAHHAPPPTGASSAQTPSPRRGPPPMSSRPPPTRLEQREHVFSSTLGSEALLHGIPGVLDSRQISPQGDDPLHAPPTAAPPPMHETSPRAGVVGRPPSQPARPPSSPPATTGQPSVAGPTTSARGETVPPMPIPAVLGPGDAPLALARAIASRTTGTLAFESKEGVRRAVMREGDLVTCASGVDDESLIAFLVARGDLPRERLHLLAGRFATFGRHAGAALVAQGYLRQDQLWPVLRAHAEFILGRAILVTDGTTAIEPEPPGRLRAEPSVFGGSTGAEVFVEVVRRVISPADAIARMGGEMSRLGEGPNAGLLTECALGGAELAILDRGRGQTIVAALGSDAETDMGSVLYALSLLGVVEVLRSIEQPRADERASRAEIDALDEDAIRARIRARLALVDEGDYFAVLGVPRNATGYEVRRAFLELRRVFDPARILTPGIADLAPDVRKIVVVLEEAYEILRDAARRERYRRAIEGTPVLRA